MRYALLPALLLFGCSSKASIEELQDPATCEGCHPTQFAQWSGSMHAYAGVDPVFQAWNAKGQRETNGELGDFCVKCHAPIAVREGLTTDGLNLDELDPKYLGITCYFCHSVEAVEGEHNNPLVLSDSGVMRGSIADPVENSTHDSMYSPLHDRNDIESASLCGSCHDIVNDKDVHLERTYFEWKDTLYGRDNPRERQTCGRCHMPGSEGLAAEYEGVYLRRIHDHSVPAVDVALIDFPDRERQRAEVQRLLDTSLFSTLCVLPGPAGSTIVTAQVENFAAGHSFPSGAAGDRRVWVELTGYQGNRVVWTTGTVTATESVEQVELRDPELWRFGDLHFDDEGAPVHDFWDVARYESLQLPGPTSNDPSDPEYRPTHLSKQFEVSDILTRVTMAVKFRPIGRTILDDLVENASLAPEVRDAMPTFTLRATELDWRAQDAVTCVPFTP